MDSVAELLYEYLRGVLYTPSRARLDIADLPVDFRELGQGLVYLAGQIDEMRAFAKSLMSGDLSAPAPSHDNELAAPLKALQTKLIYLTWQVQQVARGDYRQHVAYLGEFATAFNMISRQLEQREASLAEEIERSRRKTRALEEISGLFELVAREGAQWVIVADKSTGEWIYSNHPAMNILTDEAFIPQLRRWISDRLTEPASDLMSRTHEIQLSDSGVAQVLSAAVRPVLWRDRPSLAFVLTDISEERSRSGAKSSAGFRDTLTRQYNRHFGMMTLEQWLLEDRAFTLCFVDIDNLKYVNDRFGHLEGDDYILDVTAVLRGFSPDVIISRLGGDEFMLLAEGWDEERMTAHIETLRGRLLKHNLEPGVKYYHSLSYGAVCVEPGSGLTASGAMAVADARMYEYRRGHKLEGLAPAEE